MQTLIELYDERPIENVLAMEVFRPAEVVFLCPAEAAQDRAMQEKLLMENTIRIVQNMDEEQA